MKYKTSYLSPYDLLDEMFHPCCTVQDDGAMIDSEPPNPDNVPEDGKLKSTHIVGGTRRYYLDLKENQRGRFLRVSQTQPRGGPRSQIAIPAQGMEEFKNILSGLLEVYGTDDHGKPCNRYRGKPCNRYVLYLSSNIQIVVFVNLWFCTFCEFGKKKTG